MVDNMDYDLKNISYDELLDLYQEVVNFIDYLDDLYKRIEGDKDE